MRKYFSCAILKSISVLCLNLTNSTNTLCKEYPSPKEHTRNSKVERRACSFDSRKNAPGKKYPPENCPPGKMPPGNLPPGKLLTEKITPRIIGLLLLPTTFPP